MHFPYILATLHIYLLICSAYKYNVMHELPSEAFENLERRVDIPAVNMGMWKGARERI